MEPQPKVISFAPPAEPFVPSSAGTWPCWQPFNRQLPPKLVPLGQKQWSALVVATSSSRFHRCPRTVSAPTDTSTFGTPRDRISRWPIRQRYLIKAQLQHDLCCPEATWVFLKCYSRQHDIAQIECLCSFSALFIKSDFPDCLGAGQLSWFFFQERKKRCYKHGLD